jgi:2-iminobutanoate/2-iminopropanoate deaminase
MYRKSSLLSRKQLILTIYLISSQLLYAQKKPELVQFVNPQVVASPTGYSHVAVVDLGNSRMLIISGQVPLDEKGQLKGGQDFGSQTEQVFENLQKVIKSFGGTMNHLVKTGIFLTDAANVPLFREIRNKYVNIKNPPASTLVEVKGLFRKDILIEIEATAIIPK